MRVEHLGKHILVHLWAKELRERKFLFVLCKSADVQIVGQFDFGAEMTLHAECFHELTHAIGAKVEKDERVVICMKP